MTFDEIVAKLTGKKGPVAQQENAEQTAPLTMNALADRISALEQTNSELQAINEQQSAVIASNEETNTHVLAYIKDIKAENEALAKKLDEVTALTSSSHYPKLDNQNLAHNEGVKKETKAERMERVMRETAQKNGQI